jgi:hypothetical protein
MVAGIDASARVSSCPVRARMCLDKVAGLIPFNPNNHTQKSHFSFAAAAWVTINRAKVITILRTIAILGNFCLSLVKFKDKFMVARNN